MTRVTFSVDHVTSQGRTFKRGSTHDVSPAEARELIFNAKAVAASPAPAPVEPVAAKPAQKSKEG